MSDYVTCETVAAIVVHIRRASDAPVRLNGHTSPRPTSLCGMEVAWDTQIPVSSATCRKCIAAIRGKSPEARDNRADESGAYDMDAVAAIRGKP